MSFVRLTPLMCGLVAGCFLAGPAAEAATILVDIGGGGSQTTTDALGRSWNNLATLNTSNDNVGGVPLALITSANTASGYTLSVGNPSGTTDAIGFNDANLNGTLSPSGDAAARGYPATATQDSGYGNTVAFTNGTVQGVTLTVAGLEANGMYDLHFFASRIGVSDNRQTQYGVVGATTATAYLDAVNNTSNVASVLNIAPDANHQITINLSPGPDNTNASGFYYLGVLEITSAVPEPGSLMLLGAGGLALRRRRVM
jgi:hypothetical protein